MAGGSSGLSLVMRNQHDVGGALPVKNLRARAVGDVFDEAEAA